MVRFLPMSEKPLSASVARVRDRIQTAAARASRQADEVTLIAVSKTHGPETIRTAFEAGITHFGENRVQEWEAKRSPVADLPATWHLIGHLQSNKAARAAKEFHSVDSVDDLALARRLDHARSETADLRKLRVLIEVRVALEETKNGVEKEHLPELAEKICGLERLELAGLMCIPPFMENLEKVRPYFAELRSLKERLERGLGRRLPVLSMGMSHDFEVAIEEGATEVRVGTALFGAREAR